MIATAIVAMTVSACSGPGAGRGTGAVELEPCRLRGDSGLTSLPAQCGWLSVPENRAGDGGATIDLFIARIPALNPRSADEAFTVLAGGPGQAATGFYPDYAAAFERIHRFEDIVLVDQRGTGRSARLDCEYPETDMLEFSPESAAAIAQRCLDKLGRDPRHYTTSVAVADLDSVREALGYRRLNVYGISYGTRVAQHYLRRYPDRVRSVVIDGIVPPETILGPDIAADAQAALQNLFGRCAGDPACNSHFPEIDTTFQKLAATLRAGPVKLTLPAPVSGELTEVSFDYNTFAGTVRLMSYAPSTIALLPLLLHEAGINGNWQPLAAQAQMTMREVAESMSEGMHHAVVCTEDVPFFDPGSSQQTAFADTYLGDLQVASLNAICEIWPDGVIDEAFHEALVSDVPVLLLSGTDDPITPPRNGDRAAVHLSNSLHVVGPGHGHGMLTRNCVPRLIADFVETASFDGLDTSCVGQDRAEPFFTSFAGPEP